MSDGPHRSLPMRPHWRVLAQRAAQGAFAPEEVREALPYALKCDFLEVPIKAVREIMDGDTLFPELRMEQLDRLRASCRGSAVANRVIDCALEALRNGLTGYGATHTALTNALEETAHSGCRGIEEHHQRKASSGGTGFVRARLDDARQPLDCGAIARELLVPETPPTRRSVSLPRRKGVDEGPPLR
jgi:hypothetical protein